MPAHETAAPAELGQHVGRLASLDRHHWFQILAVGPDSKGETVITVPASRHNDPAPQPPTMKWPLPTEPVRVMDLPDDLVVREDLVGLGHCLAAPADLPDDEMTRILADLWRAAGTAANLSAADASRFRVAAISRARAALASDLVGS